MLTEQAHRFLLAHEAAHILLGHIRSTWGVARVGDVFEGKPHSRQNDEAMADLCAATALMSGSLVDSTISDTEIERMWRTTFYAIHLLFAAIRMYEEAFYVGRPTIHPDYASRLTNVLGGLKNLAKEPWLGGRTLSLGEPSEGPIDIGVVGFVNLEAVLNEAVTQPYREHSYSAFLDELRTSRYFLVDDASKPELDLVEQVEFMEPLVNATDITVPLTLVAHGLFPWIAPTSSPSGIREVVASAGAWQDDAAIERAFQVAMAEIGRRIVLGPLAGMKMIRDELWQPEAGTPFHSWALRIHVGLKEFDGLFRISMIQISAIAAVNGPSALRVATDETCAWLNDLLGLDQYPELARLEQKT